MAKLDPAQISKIGGGAPSPTGGMGGFQQALSTIREILNMARELQGHAGEPAQMRDTPSPQIIEHKATPVNKSPEPPLDKKEATLAIAATFLDVAIDAGQGERTIGELLELAGPIKVKQLRALLQKGVKK